MLFARIYDPTGPFDGLNGYVTQVVEYEDRAALEAEVGAEFVGLYVETSDPMIVGWRYEDGQFGEA